MNPTLGALKLAGSIVLFDFVLLLVLLGMWPQTKGVSDWLGGVVLIEGYRLASLQPVVLLALLRLCGQEFRKFSPTLTTLLSLMSSVISVYTIGLLVAMMTGGGPKGEFFPIANEFAVNLFAGRPLTSNPALLLAALALSPWMVLAARSVGQRLN